MGVDCCYYQDAGSLHSFLWLPLVNKLVICESSRLSEEYWHLKKFKNLIDWEKLWSSSTGSMNNKTSLPGLNTTITVFCLFCMVHELHISSWTCEQQANSMYNMKITHTRYLLHSGTTVTCHLSVSFTHLTLLAIERHTST